MAEPTMTEVFNDYRRGKLSTRRRVEREANRRGLVAGILSRASKPMGRAEARAAAADSAEGRSPMYDCAVPERWRPLFKRVFVKAAVHAAHTKRTVTATA